MKKISTIVLILLVMILASLIIKAKNSDASYLMYDTISPCYKNIEEKRLIPGNLYPLKEIEIKSSISGTLEKLFVQIGDKVNVGDKIAQIKLVPSPASVEVAKSNLITARINFETEEKNYQRFKKLYEEKLIAASDFETYQKNYDLSKEQLNNAQTQLNLLQEGFANNNDISNVVKATTRGTIIDLPLKDGASVIERNNFSDGTTVAVVARLDSFIFRGKLNETDLSLLKTGMNLTVNFNAYKNQSRTARLNKVSAKGTDDQGIMKYFIEARFGMAKDTLVIRSGYTAIGEIVLQKKSNVLAIEEKNLLFENDSTYVETLNKDNKFEKKFVITGISDGIYIEIIKGIFKNDKIKVR